MTNTLPVRVSMRMAVLAFLTTVPLLGAPYDSPPITPTSPIVLFDGKTVKDLSEFYIWLGPLGH